MTWLEVFLVDLAGEMRLESAVPLIVSKLYEEGDVLNEDCVQALAKIGTDEAALKLAEGFGAAPFHYRLHAADALGRIHSDVAVQKSLDLLQVEKDACVRGNLGLSLVSQFATEAVEPVRQMVLKGDYEGTGVDLKGDLVHACQVMAVRFPEFDVWEKEARQQQEQVDRNVLAIRSGPPPRLSAPRSPLPTPFRTSNQSLKIEKKGGRNDPCPCGSGKKFKNCCMKRQGGY